MFNVGIIAQSTYCRVVGAAILGWISVGRVYMVIGGVGHASETSGGDGDFSPAQNGKKRVKIRFCTRDDRIISIYSPIYYIILPFNIMCYINT